MLNKNDRSVIRKLAGQIAEIAALPVQEEKRVLWRKLNARKPERPMVMIDQVCWNEMNVNDELTLQCEDAECRAYEWYLRSTLYQWKHFPVDMVVEPYVDVPKVIHYTRFGIRPVHQTVRTDPDTLCMSRHYENQLQNEEDLEKVKVPKISHDAAETERRVAVAHELFDGLLEVRPQGADGMQYLCLSLWDPISSWMGVEDALYAMVDKPDFMHRLLTRMTNGYLSMLDQLEEQGLVCQSQTTIHCTGAYTDELPAPGCDPKKPRIKDIWCFGLAQMLCTVSPEMFREFEVDYCSRIFERFGMVYYGCCDALDGKMAEVRQIPNVRKVSMSAWANQERGAAEIRGDYVFSRKPNPAFLAAEHFDTEPVRADLIATRQICEKHGCPLELILKDISTVHREPKRIWEWSRIAMEVVGG